MPAGQKEYAADLDLDQEQFNRCVDGNQHIDTVRDISHEAQSRGVTGTPTFFINGEKVESTRSFAQLKEVFGLPIALFGAGFYAIVLIMTAVRRRVTRKQAEYALLGRLMLTLAGTLYSGYLTYVEPYVLEAICRTVSSLPSS